MRHLLQSFARWIVLPVFVVWVAALAIANSSAVEINLWPLPWMGVWPLSLVIFVFAALGYLLGRLAGFIDNVGVRSESRRLRKKTKNLEKEIQATERDKMEAI